MESLIIHATCNTPAVSFSTDGKLSISGRSITTKTWGFYNTLFSWLEEYAKDPAPVTVLDLEFEVLNVDSLGRLMDLFRFLTRLRRAGFEAEINWYFEKEDEDMTDVAAMVSEILGTIPVNGICIEKDVA